MTGPESYRVILAPRAIRALNDGLPPGVAAACYEFIAGPLAANPHRLGKPLRGHLAGYHSARRGTYRVIYSIDEDDHLLSVVRIDHRRAVYR